VFILSHGHEFLILVRFWDHQISIKSQFLPQSPHRRIWELRIQNYENPEKCKVSIPKNNPCLHPRFHLEKIDLTHQKFRSGASSSTFFKVLFLTFDFSGQITAEIEKQSQKIIFEKRAQNLDEQGALTKIFGDRVIALLSKFVRKILTRSEAPYWWFGSLLSKLHSRNSEKTCFSAP